MSVRHALLALLSEGPKYGLQLRQEFEAGTGDVWPFNVGQVYTTLHRLERDGMVEAVAGDEGPQRAYHLTDLGATELDQWLRTPPDMSSPPRDELVIKVLIGLRLDDVDIRDLVQVHRRQLVELMQQYTRLKEDATDEDIGLRLVIDSEVCSAWTRWSAGSTASRVGSSACRCRCQRRRSRGRRPTAPSTRGGPAMTALHPRGISKSYGAGPSEVHALVDIDLAVEAGSLVAVMGPSGSGKSTLLTIAGTLEEPSSGEVLIDGGVVSAMSANDRARMPRRTVGYVFQDFNLLAGLTVAENVTLPLELDGTPLRKARPLGLEALDRLGVADKAERFPDDLFGGERQRVAIACAIVGDRHLLLADEPTGALDSVNGEAVMRLLRAACRSGVAGVVVTHDAQLCVVGRSDRVPPRRTDGRPDRAIARPRVATRTAAPMTRHDGGVRGRAVARRAIRRWSWRLLRREWRQQVLVMGLLTFAVVAAVFAATAAYNMVSIRDPQVNVLGLAHTATIGLVEIAIGAVLLVCAFGYATRALAGLIGVGLLVFGIVLLAEPSDLVADLNTEPQLGWLGVITGGVLVLSALVGARTRLA